MTKKIKHDRGEDELSLTLTRYNWNIIYTIILFTELHPHNMGQGFVLENLKKQIWKCIND